MFSDFFVVHKTRCFMSSPSECHYVSSITEPSLTYLHFTGLIARPSCRSKLVTIRSRFYTRRNNSVQNQKWFAATSQTGDCCDKSVIHSWFTSYYQYRDLVENFEDMFLQYSLQLFGTICIVLYNTTSFISK